MELKYNYWIGSFKNVDSVLKKSISQYTRNYSKVKIGITNKPERRKVQHSKSNLSWEKMVVLYQTKSINFINKMEKNHITYQKLYVINQRNGGGGPNGKIGPYYLYVLLKK
ncbi:hypothetical protein Q361_104159 [Flavobacterium croceum DSM 17960]|uniref:GIY-YIG domain-containing protein n=1 Tax=Flavobacterium croceum DSM 17960 TaxID=1121886 RepID=A0A2S4N9S9_9FLAO|nr:hypothetical protein [Flavobacterium croceum]POS02437.1 hypothetical protein Q361_104159 [Flavobacterium croceum DSM 17960]